MASQYQTPNVAFVGSPNESNRAVTHAGPSCLKITMLLVNASLKLIIKYGIYANIFVEKNMCSFCIRKKTTTKNL